MTDEELILALRAALDMAQDQMQAMTNWRQDDERAALDAEIAQTMAKLRRLKDQRASLPRLTMSDEHRNAMLAQARKIRAIKTALECYAG